MSKYTTSIETIICSQTKPDSDIYKRIEEGRKFLFDFSYEHPDEDFKKSFETQFIEKYWIECIGYETVPLFKMKLKQRLEMIMPEVTFKYNALLKIMEIEEPNLDRYGESHEDGRNHSENSATSKVDGSGTSTGSSSGTTANKQIGSDLPANIIDADTISEVTHANDGSIAEGLSENSNSSSNTTTSKGTSNSNNDANHSIDRIFKEYGNKLDAFEKWYNAYNNLMAELIASFDDMFIQLLF